MTAEECPVFLKPRLRLFLSADIVGSTALKQSRGPHDVSDIRKHYAWFSVIQGFYIEARRSFLEEWEAASATWAEFSDCFGETPRLWKTIGDEVVFEKILTDHRQLATTLQCWIRAVEKMRAFVKSRSPSLDIKCAAWLAGFPIRNKEVVLSQSPALDDAEVNDYSKISGDLLNTHYSEKTDSKLIIDYIGPSIDIGFRIAGHSTPRKFVLSVGIPYILSLTSPTQTEMIGDFPIFYDGARALKGVLGGVNYPIFWIDMSTDDSVAYHEDKLTNARPAARDDIRRFCNAFYEENSVYTHRPFIDSPNEQQIALKPDWWPELHTNLVKNFVLPDAYDAAEPTEAALGEDKPLGPDEWGPALKDLVDAMRLFATPTITPRPTNDDGDSDKSH